MKHPPVIPASSSWNVPTMGLIECIGGCMPPFVIGIVFDVVGVVLLFVGIFANLRIDGRFYGDFLIYTGSLVVFISLAFWIIWYIGNVQVPEDAGLKKRSSIVQLARKLSERLSRKLKGEAGVKSVEDVEYGSQAGAPAHKASRVTWGRSTAYHNEGYEDCVDSPAVDKRVETEQEDKPQI